MNNILYMERLPVRHLDIMSTDRNISIKLTGISGDSVRTCIYYEIEQNPLDYQTLEAFLTDDRGRTYCLVSAERRGKDKYSTWMEFGPVSPDAGELNVHIIRLQQSPTFNDFTFKGRSFIDPWNPEFPINRDLITRMDSLLKSPGECKHLATPEWELCGNWDFNIKMGEWEDQEIDCIKSLTFSLPLGSETISFREFRNSNTGSFISFETNDASMEKMGDRLRDKMLGIFNKAEQIVDFKKALRELGIDPGYTPVCLNLEIHDPKSGHHYIADFIDTRGVLGNRIYHFFNDCFCGRKYGVEIVEIKNLKLDPPLICSLDVRLLKEDITLAFDYNFGGINAKGEVVINDIIFSEESMRVNCNNIVDGDLESMSLADVRLVMEDEGGKDEIFPSLGNETRYNTDKNILIFPPIHLMNGEMPGIITLVINSINIKPKERIRFEFEAPDNSPCECAKVKNQD